MTDALRTGPRGEKDVTLRRLWSANPEKTLHLFWGFKVQIGLFTQLFFVFSVIFLGSTSYAGIQNQADSCLKSAESVIGMAWHGSLGMV